MADNRVCRALLSLLIISVMVLVFNIRSIGAPSSSFLSGTTVGGPITSDTTWTEANSPYIVTSSVLVSEGVTLTIEPGVVVKFDLAKGLQVDGQLIARGTEAKPIVFTSIKDDTYAGDSNGDGNLTIPAPGDWSYIFFTDLSVDATFDDAGTFVSGSILEYCVIKYGGCSGAQGALRIDLSAPFLNYSVVSNSANSGIFVTKGAVKIANNIITLNNGTGIYVDNYPSGDVSIIHNTVTKNLQQGIYVYTQSGTGMVLNNTVTKNVGIGICVTCGEGFFEINSNLIDSNSDGGVNVNGLTLITNNIITHNSRGYEGWSWGGGGGIYAYSYYDNQTITNNIIAYNTAFNREGGGIYACGYYGNHTITNNIIAYNTASNGGALYYSASSGTLTVSDNSVIGNTATANAIVYIDSRTDLINTFRYNLLTQNRDNSNVSSSLTVSGLPTVNYNNFFNNFHSYEIYNVNVAGPSHLNARSNWWGTPNETVIQAKIFDWLDNATKGIVDYAPYDTSIRTDVPISSPTNLTVTAEGTNLALRWNPNPESDLAGYKVQYDTDSGYPYTYSVDVGNVTTYTLTGLPPNAIYFAVTAYDTDADGSNDLFEGHESWYAYEAIADFTPPTIETPSRIPAGDVQGYQSVNVSVIVTDAESGVKNVTLLYIIDNGTTWTSILMNHSLSTSLYEATISGQPWGTTVKYKIVAYDYAGNNATKDGTEPYYTYQVIAEFPSLIITPLFMIMTLLAVIVHRRERSKLETKRK